MRELADATACLCSVRPIPRGLVRPTAAADRSKHLGATDDEVVPITPPMAGPADLIGERNEDAQGNDGDAGDEMIDPREELTPG